MAQELKKKIIMKQSSRLKRGIQLPVVLVVSSASMEAATKKGPVKEALRVRLCSVSAPVVTLKTRREVETLLVNRAPKKMLKPLFGGTRIPPVPPVTSSNEPKI